MSTKGRRKKIISGPEFLLSPLNLREKEIEKDTKGMGKNKSLDFSSLLKKKLTKAYKMYIVIIFIYDLIIKIGEVSSEGLQFKYLTSWINFSWNFKCFSPPPESSTSLVQALPLRIVKTGRMFCCCFPLASQTFTPPS